MFDAIRKLEFCRQAPNALLPVNYFLSSLFTLISCINDSFFSCPEPWAHVFDPVSWEAALDAVSP